MERIESDGDDYFGIIKISDEIKKDFLRPRHMSFILDKGKTLKADPASMKIELNGKNSMTFFFNLLTHKNFNVEAIHLLHSNFTSGKRRSKQEASKISQLNVQFSKR